jgi:hypothetical protein
MPKNSGESMRTIRTSPKPQPSRPIKHGFGRPVGPKVAPNAMGAPKRADALKPSPGDDKPKPQMVF